MSNKYRKEQLIEFQSVITYSFKNPQLIDEALTHSSFANEMKTKKVIHNERLEFLGDSILSLAISDYIFHQYKHLPEGELTKVRANVVCESSLASKARLINIGEYLLLGKGEDNTGGRNRGSILADAFEAVIGAIYLDGGFNDARSFILSLMTDLIDMAVNGKLVKDYKTHLQELLQSKSTEKIIYNVVKETGPDHDKTFDIEILFGGKVLGEGQGKSKKEAEQNAAMQAILKERYKDV
ncbi:ribonuclease III [Alkaliphilus peptidifermentans]|uniref:Ribonuclease 3 n=1 Tax=Alkaliphilus peptidifermentans DSM 18978 TaxID=1120976 RepID=A0A1G5J9F2_9FIRM|nr:ribonuclease III [Alkaliphilus peptidifermentans]SCY84857.1 RNAse III [Alkaliphilus peptidifermentans DSM 18978]